MNYNQNNFNQTWMKYSQYPTIDISVFMLDFKDDEELETITKVSTFDIDSQVTLSLALKHEIIHKETTETKMPMLVSLVAGEIKGESKVPIDMICVIDYSGSMKGEKWTLLLESFKSMLEFVKESDRLSIVIFNGNATRITPLLKMNEKNKIATLEKLSAISPNGGTDITKGVTVALEILKQRRINNEVTSILVLSDGQDGRAMRGVPNVVDYYQNEKFILDPYSIHAFGYGRDHDPVLINKIAEIRNGSFYFIDKLEVVDECFVNCLGDLASVVAQDVFLTVKPSNFIKIVKSYAAPGFWKVNDSIYTATIPQMIAEKSLDYVFEIEIVDMEKVKAFKGIQIATVTCELKGLRNEGYKTYFKNDSISLKTSEDEMLLILNSENEKVMVNYQRVISSEAMEKATNLADCGNYNAAKIALEDVMKSNKNSNHSNNLQSQNIMKDIEQSLKMVRPEVYTHSGKQYLVESSNSNMRQANNLNSFSNVMNNQQSVYKNQLNIINFQKKKK